MIFSENNQFTFQKGDTIGFTWTDTGVISFEGSFGNQYCESNVAPTTEGSVVVLVDNRGEGNRIYSIQALYRPTNTTGYYGMIF